jgi:hypothetical protein
MYDMPNSTASSPALESTQYDFSQSLQELCNEIRLVRKRRLLVHLEREVLDRQESG